eukprot:359740-Chlamydomonas_euryale.AAC.9
MKRVRCFARGGQIMSAVTLLRLPHKVHTGSSRDRFTPPCPDRPNRRHHFPRVAIAARLRPLAGRTESRIAARVKNKKGVKGGGGPQSDPPNWR